MIDLFILVCVFISCVMFSYYVSDFILCCFSLWFRDLVLVHRRFCVINLLTDGRVGEIVNEDLLCLFYMGTTIMQISLTKKIQI